MEILQSCNNVHPKIKLQTLYTKDIKSFIDNTPRQYKLPI